jgi:hypothetical protein
MDQWIEMSSKEAQVPKLHLSSAGPYRDTIEALSKKYPNLSGRDCSFYANDRRYASTPRIACFDFTDPKKVAAKISRIAPKPENS